MPHEKTRLELRTRAVGPWQTNSYVLICPTTRQSVIVDPAAEAQTLLEMLGDSQPSAILVTHAHIDHIGALDEMRAELKVPVMAHVAAKAARAGRWLADGDLVRLGEHALRVYHTPGHAEDMVCFAVMADTRVIVGDTVFEGGPGKTWSTGDFQTTLGNLRNVVLAWPDETVCYPGHGSHFRLGDRRRAIEAFVSKDHRGVYGDATWDT